MSCTGNLGVEIVGEGYPLTGLNFVKGIIKTRFTLISA